MIRIVPLLRRIAASLLLFPALPCGAAVVEASYNSAADIPVTASTYAAAGNSVNLALNFAPATGSNLTVVNVSGLGFISGRFDNLAQGQRLNLSFGGIRYPFVANYYGGSGNDLVLEWGNVRAMGWGENASGQLGLGHSQSTKLPGPVVTSGAMAGKTILQIAEGYSHTVALCSDGSLFAWGYNDSGQLGNNSTTYSDLPVAVDRSGLLAGKTVISISAGSGFTLALCADGTLAFWGDNGSGAAGDGQSSDSMVPKPVQQSGVLAGKSVVSIATGGSHCLALCSDGTLAAWGGNGSAQIGDGTTNNQYLPIAVPMAGVLAGKSIVAIAAGTFHSYALCSDGTLAAWGGNGYGQLGNNASSTASSPTPVAVVRTGVLAGKTITSIGSGNHHGIVLCSDSTVATWGYNDLGQLGNNSQSTSKVPVAVIRSGVLAGKTITAVNSQFGHAFALCSDGTLAGWGANGAGQLGDDTTINARPVPVLVKTTTLQAGERFHKLARGSIGTHSIALVASPPAAVALTQAASEVSDQTVTLRGTANANGSATTLAFEYGATPALGKSIAASPASVSGSSDTAVSAALSGLLPGSTYYYRLAATSVGGTVTGETLSFTTSTVAALSSLTTPAGTLSPAFQVPVTSYRLTVPSDTTGISFTATVAQAGATASVGGNTVVSGVPSPVVPLVPGNNNIPVTVSSGDGLIAFTYTVQVTRLPATFEFNSAADTPLTAAGFDLSGKQADFALKYVPKPGATLTVLRNTGGNFLQGSFTNLAQGQLVTLAHEGFHYAYVADYYGGSGNNDLVLRWANSRAVGWANNEYGELGFTTPTQATSALPVNSSGVLAGRTLIATTAGNNFSLAIDRDGLVYAWGQNQYGQLGNGNTTLSALPVKVITTGALAGKRVIAVTAGYNHSLALCSDGTLAAWGQNEQGQLGNGTTGTSVQPVAVDQSGVLAGKTVVQIASDGNFNLALCGDGTLAAWGQNSWGNLGDGSLTARNRPVAVIRDGYLRDRTVTQISVGSTHCLALLSDGSLAGWGRNDGGHLGDGSLVSTKAPVAAGKGGALTGKTVVAISSSQNHNLALCNDGSIAAWGTNNSGELGNGSTSSSAHSLPVAVVRTGVLASRTVTGISAAYNFSQASCSDGSMAAWGYNQRGELGIGSTSTNSTVPVLQNPATAYPGCAFTAIGPDVTGTHMLTLLASPPAPSVETLVATAIKDLGATLNAGIRPNGGNTTISFEYGLTTNYGTVVPASPASASGSALASVQATLTGLRGGATYHYRAIAANGGGEVRGADATFTTTTAAALASLSAGGHAITPAFAPEILAYAVTVPNSTTSIVVDPRAAANDASITVSGSPLVPGGNVITLVEGPNPVPIVVNAADGINSRTYTLTVTRMPGILRMSSASQPALALVQLDATGQSAALELQFAPVTGSNLRLIDMGGYEPIRGFFSNLAHGQQVTLSFGGVEYRFVANYYGGDGNDLVLHWANSRMFGWGINTNGALGVPPTGNLTVPTPADASPLMAGKTILSLATGRSHSLALLSNGTVVGWGANNVGQLGTTSVGNTTAVAAAADTTGVLAAKIVSAIAAGDDFSLALCSDGTVVAWGNNEYGQLGNGSSTLARTPIDITQRGALAGKRVIALAAGAHHALACCADGTVVAWGRNDQGQVGNGLTGNATLPVLVNRDGALAIKTVTKVAGGVSHSLVLCSDGSLIAWGRNDSGQAGDGTLTSRLLPVAVLPGVIGNKVPVKIASGGSHNLVLCQDGTLVSWGENLRGQLGLGDGSSVDRNTPSAVITSAGALVGKTVTGISAGANHSLAFCSDGTAAGWGYDANGQRGDGDAASDQTRPAALATTNMKSGERFVMLSACPVFDISLALVAAPPAPTAITLASTGASDTGALLNGAVRANGGSATVRFEYGLTTAYGSTISATPPTASGTSETSVFAIIGNLTPGATYHYRAVAEAAGGTSYGEDRTVTTTTVGTLAALSLSQGTLSPAFDLTRTQYLATVPASVESITVTPVTSHPAATVLVNGTLVASGSASAPLTLQSGTNPVTVLVASEDGLDATNYQVTVTRLPESFAFPAANSIPVTANGFLASGNAPAFLLGHAPQIGAGLRVVDNTGAEAIRGRFENLANGQRVLLEHGGITYSFVANYSGGTGNDLVLEWGNTRLMSWGNNGASQSGSGLQVSSLPVPTPVVNSGALAGKTARLLNPGGFHVVAMSADGSLFAWGDNDYGQLADATTTDRPQPVVVPYSGALAGKTISILATGYYHSLALCTDGSLVAWGQGNYSQLGTGSTNSSPTPVAVNTSGVLAGKRIIAIAAGTSSSYAVCDDGTIAAWGNNTSGQLGIGSTTPSSSSVPVAVVSSGVLAGKRPVAIAAGMEFAIVLCDDGSLAAWGANSDGQMGDGSTTPRPAPVLVNRTGVLAGKSVLSFVAGNGHVLARLSDGSLAAWGENLYGSLGDGTTTDRSLPVLVNRTGVLAGKTIVDIDAGDSHSVAVCSDGSMATWGYNQSGQLGDNSNTSRSLPVLVNTSALIAGERFIQARLSHNASSHAIVAAPPAPVATTLAATGLRDDAALLNASVAPNGQTNSVWFEFGPSEFLGSVLTPTPASVSGTGTQAVSHALTRLVPGSTYYYRVVASGPGGIVRGDTLSFTTTTKATLAGLTSSEGPVAPDFNPLSADYTLSVPATVQAVTFTATPAIEGTTFTVAGIPASSGQASAPVALTTGQNPVDIVSTSGDGSSSLSYRVTVTRLPEAVTFNSASDVPLRVDGLGAEGNLGVSLGFAPGVGTALTVVDNRGRGFIRGNFGNLPQGGVLLLEHAGITYEFVANYFGGDGNDLVLQWANVRPFGWGRNENGQVGNRLQASNAPAAVIDDAGVLAGKTVVRMATGADHTLALCADGTLAAWGANAYGQLGSIAPNSSNIPLAVDLQGELAGKTVIAIAAGAYHSLALCSDGSLAAWGYNQYGQLGPWEGKTSGTPRILEKRGFLSGKKVVKIAAGGAFSLALCDDGTLAAWGLNSEGQLGDGSIQDRIVPVQVGLSSPLAGRKVTAIAAGSTHAAALCDDGTLLGWGNNFYYQMGDGSQVNRLRPGFIAPVGALAGKQITAIASGNQHMYALCADGSLAGWGNNGQGQLGVGNQTHQTTPAAVNLSGVLAGKSISLVSAGVGISYALCTDGTTAAWGYNGYNALGTLPTTSGLLPGLVQAGQLLAGEKFVFLASGNSSSHVAGIAASPARPTATTLAAQASGDTAATLNGTVRANTSAATAWFEYGTTTAYGQQVSAQPGTIATGSTTAVSATLTGLQGSSTYHYRAVASGAGGLSYGEDRTFTTGSAAALASLELAGATLSPAFRPEIASYKATVPTAAASTQLSATAQDPTAIVRIGSGTAAQGSAMATVNLNPGSNAITVTVTGAESATRSYQLTVVRFPEAITWLTGQEKPIQLESFIANGPAPALALGYAPLPGTNLTLAEQTGFLPLAGRFDGLAQGQAVTLVHEGISYRFIANYHGGDGNDLVLEWASRRIVGWGLANGGQLASPGLVDSTLPVAATMTAFPASGTVFAVDAHAMGSHALALGSDGIVYAWGANNAGQLGNGSTNPTTGIPLPAAVNTSGILAGKRVVKIAAGQNHSLALCEDGTLAAWGSNSEGQLGIGSQASQSLPVAVDLSGVLAGKTILAISASQYASFAACSDGTVASWGGNGSGIIGNGSLTGIFTRPVAVVRSGVLKNRTVVKLAAGENHCLAICSDGSLVAWGQNTYGQLGDNTSNDSSVPLLVTTTGGPLAGKQVIQAAAARAHSIALCSDGTVAAWGRNNFAEVGNGNTTTVKVPVAITNNGALSGKSVTAVDASVFNGFAIAANGSAAAWGYNVYGQLGNGTKLDSSLPVAVLPGTVVLPGERFIAGTAGNAFHLGLLASPPAPQVETLAASALSDNGATLNASAIANGSTTTLTFEYGLSAAYGSVVDALPATATGSAPVAASAALTGLLPGTTYHYRAIARSGGGVNYGESRTFTTTRQSVLAGLTPSHGSLYPAFAHNQARYSVTVPFAVASLTLNPVAEVAGSSISINGGAPAAVALAVGSNTITVQVQGPGAGPFTYTITVTRLPERFAFSSASGSGASGADFDLSGLSAAIDLLHVPATGTTLKLLDNTGSEPARGEFTNLPHGGIVTLDHEGIAYEFVANYYGGDGNDLVLQWARTRLVGWGNNSEGQLGDGLPTSNTVPMPLRPGEALGDTPVLALAAGYEFTLALAADGEIHAWGLDDLGQLGQAGKGRSPAPVKVDRTGVLAGRRVIAIDAGYYHAIALCSDGKVVAWGSNGANQLGVTGIADREVPGLVDDSGVLADKRVVKISAGLHHNLALCSDGTLVAWGDNGSGRLGNNRSTVSTSPVLVNTDGVLKGKRVIDISAGNQHSLALCSDGTIAAWGNNESGQLGLGSIDSPKLVPVAVPVSGALAGKTVVGISAGHFHNFAWCSDGSAVAWGGNGSGRLGDGTTIQRNSPVPVTGTGALAGKQFAAMVASYLHSLALTTDGTALAWGDNGFGQLGINSTSASNVPAAIHTAGLAPGERFAALVAGDGTRQSLGVVARPPRPSVHTLAATDIAGTSATLQGRVRANGSAVDLGFEYGLTTAYGSRIDATPATASGTAEIAASGNLTGLISGATYHYRLIATGAAGAGAGEDRTFTTGSAAALASLGLSSGAFDQAFAAERLDYRVTLPHQTAQVTVAAVPVQAGAVVSINGSSNATVSPPAGVSTIAVEVTAAGGTPRQTYRIHVTRLPESFRFAAASTVPLRTDALAPAGLPASFALDFAPQPGTRLIAVDNTGTGFIQGRFANLEQGQIVSLNFGGRDYRFAANYYGGDGNDLVLEWATTRLLGWGFATSPSSKLPVAADPGGAIPSSPIVAIAGSAGHRLLLRADGSLQAWGSNSSGQLGDGSTMTSLVPVAVDRSGVLAGKTVISVATSDSYSLALCSDGTVAGWGSNSYGTLGAAAGTRETRPVEIPVAGMVSGKAVRGIAAGLRSSYAWFEDGTVVAWGNNQYGQLGNNGTFESRVPVRIASSTATAGKRIISVTGGEDCAFGLCADGTVLGWGLNSSGQLGNNSTTDSRVPVAVDSSGLLAGKSVTSLATGEGFTLALCSDGTVAAWGRNGLSQLGGNFPNNTSLVPVQIDQAGVLAGKTVTGVAAGEAHAGVLCSDGSTAMWGANSQGQVGVNSTTNQSKPVLVLQDNLLAGERFIRLAASPFGHSTYAVTALPNSPAVTTLAAMPVRGTIATLPGEILPDGVQGELQFDYGTDRSYGHVAAATPATASGSAAVAASTVLTHLRPGSTWHYRLRFVTAHGTYYGEDRTFATTTEVTLAGLDTTAGPLAPAFAPLTTRYALCVPASSTSITLNPVTAAAGATITVNGSPARSPVSLATGANDLIVEVTAPGGGDSFRYLVVVTRFPEPLRFTTAAEPLLSAREFSANGSLPPLEIGFAPEPGTVLTLVNNRGGNPIHGRFANLPHAGPIDLEAGGTAWRFVINYHGGDGNDLVLQWANSRLFGWGESFRGQMGTGYNDNYLYPTLAGLGGAMTGKQVLSAGMGESISTVLNTDGSLVAWGFTMGGMLGNGTTTGSLFPVPVTITPALAGKKIIAVVPGLNFHLVLCDDGSMAGWGSNNNGTLGQDATVNSSTVPVAIPANGALAGRKVNSVVTGGGFALALCSDGALVTWGTSAAGRLGDGGASSGGPTPVQVVHTGALAGKHVSAIAAGEAHAIALCEDGSVITWGFNDQGQLGDGTLTTRSAPVAVTGGVLAGKQVVAIAAGEDHSLALCSDGSIAAWGSNLYGMLGNKSAGNASPLPVAVDSSGVLAGKTVRAIGAGTYTSFAHCTDGTMVAWGNNQNGQVADGSITHRDVPVDVSTVTLREGERLMGPPLRDAGRHTLALGGAPLGSATTLAATHIGGTRARLHGSAEPNRNTVLLSFDYGLDSSYGSEVAATPGSASGIASTSASAGISGLKPGTTYHYRTVAEGLGGIVRGEDMTFTTLSDNALLGALGVTEGVLGPDFSPQVTSYHVSVPASISSVTVNPVTDHPRATFEIGNTTLTGQRTTIPVTVTAEDRETTKTYTLIVTQLPESFVLSADGPAPLVVDGFSARGYPAQLALGHAPVPGTIFKVVDNTGLGFIHGSFSNLARGQRVSLIYDGLEYDFVANYHGGDGNDLVLQWAATRNFGWGQNTHGQVGDGSTTRRLVPTATNESGVLAGKTVIAVSGGYLHSLALCSDGSVAAWGSSAQGQLGHGLTTTSTTPVAVDLSQVGGEVIAVAAGPFHNLALRADGRIAAWGFNNHGQLGTGDKLTQLRPVLIPAAGALAGKQVVAVAAGTYQSFALCADGTVAAWGYNDEGELGDGTIISTAVPVAVDHSGVLAGKQVAAIAAGQYHTLARCTDGTVVAWGYNARGQLGTGNQTDARSPVAIEVTGVLSGKVVLGLSAGESHSAVLCADGSVAAWGYNHRSQLGNGSTLASSMPVAVDFSGIPAGKTLASVTAGRNHHLVHFKDGTLAAWGENQQGQLGNNTTTGAIRAGLVDLTAAPAGSRVMFEASGSAAYHGLTLMGIPASRPATPSAALTAKTIGDHVDADHDGIPDVIELAFGLDPSADSSGQLPKPVWSDGTCYGFKFAVPAGVSGFLYGAEWSTTLETGSWRDIPDTGTAGFHEFKAPAATAPRLFLRLKVVPSSQ